MVAPFSHLGFDHSGEQSGEEDTAALVVVRGELFPQRAVSLERQKKLLNPLLAHDHLRCWQARQT
jgi:hypothetical protein